MDDFPPASFYRSGDREAESWRDLLGDIEWPSK